jgi:hypothetical protein
VRWATTSLARSVHLRVIVARQALRFEGGIHIGSDWDDPTVKKETLGAHARDALPRCAPEGGARKPFLAVNIHPLAGWHAGHQALGADVLGCATAGHLAPLVRLA